MMAWKNAAKENGFVELNADIVFFQYLDQIKAAAAGSDIKLPEADQYSQG